MRLFIFRLPIKFFWYTISFVSIILNLMVYLVQRDIVVAVSTGYTVSVWERIIHALQEFYILGV